ncbi:MAG: hypothetical protein KGS48_04005 [Bacteroidetes bacterium]|nr:hypothetical protein [Bacteroidota bacterium]
MEDPKKNAIQVGDNNVFNIGNSNVIVVKQDDKTPETRIELPGLEKAALAQLIQRNELDLALMKIHDYLPDMPSKTLCMQLSGRFSKMKYDEKAGVITAEQANLELNQLRLTTIELFQKINA